MTDLRLPSAILFTTLLATSACDGDGDDGMDSADGPSGVCAEEDRVDDFAVDLSKTGERHTVTLVEAEPADPIRGDNTWTIMITDEAGTPMEGITVDAKPWMPDHGHGSSVEEEVTDLGSGEYMLDPLNLFMAGLWQVTLEITDQSGEIDEVMISVCVE